MSGPYVYKPPGNSSSNSYDYRNSPFLGPFYAQSDRSPFIPPMNLSPYSSPYAAPAPLPPSPNFITSPLPQQTYTPFIQYPTSQPSSPYVPAWQRERRLSWNGAPPASPGQYGGTWVRPPPERKRTRSFNENPYQQSFNPYLSPASSTTYSPYFPYSPPTAPDHALHPFLNAEIPRVDIVLDLSAAQYLPFRYIGNNQTIPLSVEEQIQPATHPPIYAMSISCDYPIPGWPVNMDFRSNNPYDVSVPPIKMGDILTVIYYQLQKRISQDDWARLSPHQQYAISQAYTKRCSAMGPAELAARNQGVKQVDFLLGKTMFKGLVRVGDNFEHLKLVVGS